MEGSGWTWTDGDLLIAEGPCLIHNIIVKGGGGGQGFTLYDGQDATSSRKIMFIGASAAAQTVPCPFPKPLRCERGLYVVESATAEILIEWEAIRA